MKENKIIILGLPNVGKSTLMNRLTNKKISIVSNLPQTTRNAIRYSFNDSKNYFELWDTPGFHKAINKLDLFLNSEIFYNLRNSNAVIIVIDSTKKINEDLNNLIKKINNIENLSKYLIFSKIDLLNSKNNNDYLDMKNNLEKILNPTKIFQLNLNSDDLFELIDEIKQNFHINLINNETFSNYDKNDDNDNFNIIETIREKVLLKTFQEVPHSVAVFIESKNYDEEKNIFHINAVIVVEKEGQKGIIIGKNGSKIKEIGILARQDLLKIYDCKINLKLFCKVEKDWRNNDYLIKSLGYKKCH